MRKKKLTEFYGYVWPSDFPVRSWYNDKIRAPSSKKIKPNSEESGQSNEESVPNNKKEAPKPNAPRFQFRGINPPPPNDEESDDSDGYDGIFFNCFKFLYIFSFIS